MSALTSNGSAANTEPVTNNMSGPPWPLSTMNVSAGTTDVLSLYGGSQYVSVGQMMGDGGNVLTVYMDRWGGDAANYILAPEMILEWPENWGDVAGAVRESSFPIDGLSITDNWQPTCLINCGGDALIEVQPVPEPATAWLLGVGVIAFLLWKRIRRTSMWPSPSTSLRRFGVDPHR